MAKAKPKPKATNTQKKAGETTTLSKFVVIKDTREQLGWHFEKSEVCEGMVVDTLKTGDYTLLGLESLLCIERKGSTTELATNLSEKRFADELVRMKNFSYAMVICEFSLEDLLAFPARTAIPSAKKRFIKKRGPYLLKQLMELWVSFQIPFLFLNNSKSAQAFSLSFMKRIWESHGATITN